ncbi:hypothetical protein [Pararhodobacter oceanensis]|uniref:hypothetical protein n=1 Tax=Pararhodobacter oceanensis TaxID=2172121 RepID=UPI000E302C27|nr:hypothetical protein [Pararhodobacter oceanensis]
MSNDVVENSSSDPARIAYEMAKDMWWETHQKNPNLSDAANFIQLVNSCALSLKGRSPEKTRLDWI